MVAGWAINMDIDSTVRGSTRLGRRATERCFDIFRKCLVPVIELVAVASPASTVKADINKVAWLGLRCKVDVASDAAGLRVDIRTKAALATSSLVAQVKALDGGKVSLAVADDSSEGTAAFVVVLDAAGSVVQKKSTTIGG